MNIDWFHRPKRCERESSEMASSAAAPVALIPAAHKLTRVNWEQLREIASKVQEALDAHGAHAHDDYAYVCVTFSHSRTTHSDC